MTSSPSLAFSIDCEFKYHHTVFDQFYACIVTNLHTTFTNRTITSVKGSHAYGKTNADVEMFFAKKENCPYLPLNLHSFFPNLEVLYVMNSNVQHLMTGDIDGLNNLKIFDVSYNPIDQIGADFFKGHENLEKISFYESHLKKVNRGALDNFTNLLGLYFDFNACIDARTDSNFDEFIANLYDKCSGTNFLLKNVSSSASNCDQVMSQSLKREDSINSSSTSIYVVLIAFTILLNIILGLILFRLFRKNYGGSWNEMRENIIQS